MLFLYDYFCILWNIHLTHARSCSCRHTLSLVFFMPSSGVGLAYLSPSLVPEPGTFESSGKVSGVGWASFVAFGRVFRPFGRRHLWGDSLAWSWVPGRVVGRWLQWSACWSRGARGRRCRIGFVWRTVSRNLHVLETARTLGRASWWAQDVGVYVHFVAGVSSVFRGSCLFDFWAPWL